MDYYLSFATSLTPNDGLGVSRAEWPQWEADSKVSSRLGSPRILSPLSYILGSLPHSQLSLILTFIPIPLLR